MTQIRSMPQQAARRPGELGVHSLDHFNLQVPDVADAEKFYGSFGLNLKEEGGNLSVYTHGHPHRWGTIAEGARKKLNYVSFGAFEDDMPRFRERLETMRIDRLDPPKGFESNGLWFRDPDGTLIEIRVAEKSSQNEKTRFDMVGGEPGIPNAPSRSKAAAVKPRRLAHILLFTRDIPKTLAFYRDVLGMRLSDRSGDLIAFMHGIHGSDHHMIAFVKSEGPGLIIARGTSARSTTSASAPITWRTRASPMAGAWAGMCSAPTTSTMSATRGAATRNILATSTTSRSTRTGRTPITRRTTRFICGARTCRRTSRTISRW
jgi:catechol 2,3-dioxygenase